MDKKVKDANWDNDAQNVHMHVYCCVCVCVCVSVSWCV
jgi:hypothetical protein